MYRSLLLILCLLLGALPIVAQKSHSKHRTPSAAERRDAAAAEREFGAASRAYEKKQRAEKARRNERNTPSPQFAPVPEPLPIPVPADVNVPRSAQRPIPPVMTQRQLDIEVGRARNSSKPSPHVLSENRKKATRTLPQSVSSKVKAPTMPKICTQVSFDKNRAIDPKKRKDRLADCARCPTILNERRFPVKLDKKGRGPIVKDALGKTIGRLATTMRAEDSKGVKRTFRQQIAINKNEGQMLKAKGTLRKYEMAPGLLLTNGQRVSGLVPRSAIPVHHRPKPAGVERRPTSKDPTIPIPITGGKLLPNPFSLPATLTTKDRNGKVVPLKFADPKFSPPRGYKGKHKEANDYLAKPIKPGVLNTEYFINVVGSKLPGGGGGGIARSVVKIDTKRLDAPIFDAYLNRNPIWRKLYAPGGSEQRGKIQLIPARLRGAESLGTVYIAAPNLPYRPLPARKR